MPAHRSHEVMEIPSCPPNPSIDSNITPEESSSDDVASSLPEANDSRKHSWIWQHGTELPPKIPGNPSRWKCNRCKQTYSTRTTCHQENHLKIHRIYRPGHTTIYTNQTTLDMARQIDEETLRELLVKRIVDRQHPLKEVEAESFRNIIEYCNPVGIKKLLKLANTMRSDVMKCFEVAKITIKKNLNAARSKIHLSFDLWTSPNYKAMVAIVGHWTSPEFKVETALLAMKEITEAHKGEFIAPVLYEVVKEFSIEDRLGYFMADNAINNDTALRFLDNAIRDEGGVGFDVEECQLRCLGHILNLTVKVLLFGGNVTALEREDFKDEDMDKNDDESEEDQNARKWCVRRVVGKLHNIVIFIRWSPQRAIK